MIYYSI